MDAWAFGKSDAWNQKQPADWTDADRERILSNSPWAKKASVAMDSGGTPMGGGPMGGGGGSPMGGGGGGPMGGGAGGMGGGGGRGGDGPPGGGGIPKIEAIVLWESAAPVRMARKEDRAGVSDAYLISVSRLAAAGGRGGSMGERPDGGPAGEQPGGAAMERLQQAARLEVKGQPPLHPRKVERMNGSGEEILFSFDRAELPITAASKEITFSVRMGPLDVKAKFSPKEMLFQEQLAI